MRLYLDTAIVIYDVERVVPFASRVQTRLSAANLEMVVSDLTRLECRVKPLREANHALVRAYDLYFDSVCAEVAPLTRQTLERAAALRAAYGFRTPDAIHLAVSIESNCGAFLTNDQQLVRCQEIPVEML